MLIMHAYISTPVVHHDSGHISHDSSHTSRLRSYISTLVVPHDLGRTQAPTVPHDFGRTLQLWSYHVSYFLIWWTTSPDQARWLQHLTTWSLSPKQVEFWVHDLPSTQNLSISQFQLFKWQAHGPRDQRHLARLNLSENSDTSSGPVRLIPLSSKGLQMSSQASYDSTPHDCDTKTLPHLRKTPWPT
jgi:hypothetical protein